MDSVILLVEDEEDLLVTLAEFLKVKLPGYRAITATSVKQAEKKLQKLDGAQLSLVCVDHVLHGDPEGIEYLQELRQRFPNVPRVLFTGRANDGEVHEACARDEQMQVVWKPAALMHWVKVMSSLL